MSPLSASRRRLLLAGSAAALAGAAVAAWLWWPRTAPPAPDDPIAAAAANARGIGHMEQFAYGKAVPEFEEAARLAPGWLPARINLGIALFNTQEEENLDRAVALFHEVLAQDADQPHAHYCLGIIHLYRNHTADAHRHFTAVTRIDPSDAHAWYHRGLTHPEPDSGEARSFFQGALYPTPCLNAARYRLAQHPHEFDEQKQKQLLTEFQALTGANWEDELRIRYTEMGRYAAVLGGSPAAHRAPGPLPP